MAVWHALWYAFCISSCGCVGVCDDVLHVLFSCVCACILGQELYIYSCPGARLTLTLCLVVYVLVLFRCIMCPNANTYLLFFEASFLCMRSFARRLQYLCVYVSVSIVSRYLHIRTGAPARILLC